MGFYLRDVIAKPSIKDSGLDYYEDLYSNKWIGDNPPPGAITSSSSELEKLLDAFSARKAAEDKVFGKSSSEGSTAKPIIYSDWSPASRLFGMDQGTAFAEHMSNTAHQREVADLKAAGLNPVLGISGSGATAVSGNAAGGSSSAAKAESFPWLDILGATASLVTLAVTKKPALSYMVGNLFKAFD